MSVILRSTFNLALVTALSASAASTQPQLDTTSSNRLDALRKSPELAGTLIYRGAVFPLRPGTREPLFSYERRVEQTATGFSSAHITQDPQGEVIIAESARFSPAYSLHRFEAVNRQQGYSGTVQVSADGRHLEYQLNENGKISRASEVVSAPVVSGPSLHGFILSHWDTLASGQRISVRMIVMAKKETYGFEIRQEEQANGNTSFLITPSSWLVRLVVDPLRVVFDSSRRTVVRYEGRVPPMEQVSGKFKEFDARVNYTMAVPSYR
jgi:hypothetical protein